MSSDAMLPQQHSLRDVWSFFRAHPALAVTVIYADICFIGAVFRVVLLARFGVNYFDYASITDFASAAFGAADVTLGALFLSLIVVTVIGWLFNRPKPPAELTGWKLDVVSVGCILLGLLFPIFPALSAATSIKEGWGSYLKLSLASEVRTLGSEGDDLMLIGTTSRFFFVYNRSASRTYVVAAESVQWLTLCTAQPRYQPTPSTPASELVGTNCHKQ
jgi:hypothetical protein